MTIVYYSFLRYSQRHVIISQDSDYLHNGKSMEMLKFHKYVLALQDKPTQLTHLWYCLFIQLVVLQSVWIGAIREIYLTHWK